MPANPPTNTPTTSDVTARRSAFEPAPMYRGDTDAALHDLRGWVRAGWQAVLVFEGHGSAERAVERLAQADIAARFVTEVGSVPRVVQVTTGRLDASTFGLWFRNSITS